MSLHADGRPAGNRTADNSRSPRQTTSTDATAAARPLDLAGVDPVVLAVALSLLPVHHPLLVAVRLGVEVAALRHAHRVHMRDASHDVHGGDGRFWRSFATNHVPYVEIARRRAVAGPMAREAS